MQSYAPISKRAAPGGFSRMTVGALLPTRDLVSDQVSSFLAHLAVGIHKLRAYPKGHPMRQVAVEAAFGDVTAFLESEPAFRIGVGQTQFVVADAVTDPDHFIIRDLAARLHRRQVGGLVFRAGVNLAEFTGALESLAIEPPRTGSAPVDLVPVSPTPNVEFSPIAFDALGLRDADIGGQVDRLWQELAQLVAADAGESGGGSGGLTVESVLAGRLANPEMRAALAAALERFGRMAQTLEGPAREDAEAKLSDLLATIPKSALAKVLEVDLTDAEGRAKLLPATEWLPTIALVELVESAAQEQGQKFSAVFLRLLRKLAGQRSEAAPRRAAGERDLRLLVRALMQDWSLADPNSKAHAHILDTLARQDLVSPADGAPTAEGLRVLQIAIETEAVGDPVVEAIEQVLAAGNVADLVRALGDTPEPNRAAAEIWRQLVAPAHLRRILHDGRLDPEVVRRLVGRIGLDGVDLLLSRLLSIPSQEIQREVAEHVLSLGPGGSLALLQRVQDAIPDERRLLLQILTSLRELPAGFTARAYVGAAEPLVRLEAIRLMARSPEDRDEAILLGLADEDERVVRLAIEIGMEDLPRQCLSRLMQLLNSPRRSSGLKASAVPMLAQFDTPAIREWLMSGMVIRRGWLRRRRLAPKSPIMLAKLAVLAVRWANHPEVARTLDLARQSGDTDVVGAISAGGVE